MMEIKELGIICEVIAGQSPPSSSYNQEEIGMPFFQGKADFGMINPTVRYWCTDPKKTSIVGDILFSVRAPVGSTNINNIDACIGRGLSAIRCGSEIDTKYLLHYLRFNEEKIASLGTGSTFKAITIKTLKKLQIPLPPLPEQKRIAAILDEADKIRQLNKKLIEHYEQLSQSLFLEMFGDPVVNPMGWEKKNLEEFLLKVKKISSDFIADTIEYIDISSIDNKKNIITGSTKYILKDRPSRAQQIVRSGDILFSTVRPNLKNIAINKIDNRIGSTGFHVIRLKDGLLSEFVFELLKNDFVTDFFAGITSGANYPALKTKDILTFKIIIPNQSLQTQFAERVQEIEQQKEQAGLSLQKSEDLFQSLLQRAFRGEL